MVRKVWAVAAGVSLAMTAAAVPADGAGRMADSAVVSKVVDGDTIDVGLGGDTVRVRFLNVNTPERGKCLADRATAYTRSKVPPGEAVTLAYDVERLDRYGRTLALVRNSGGAAMSIALARRGLGVPMLIEPNERYYAAVVSAAKKARSADLGIFDPKIGCSPVNDLRQARGMAKSAKRMPVRTQAQYDRVLAHLAAAGRLAAATKPGKYGLEGAWIQRFLKTTENATRAAIRSVRVNKVKQRKRTVKAQSGSGGGGSSGGSSGGGGASGGSSGGGSGEYTGPRCYDPGGVTYHPC